MKEEKFWSSLRKDTYLESDYQSFNQVLVAQWENSWLVCIWSQTAITCRNTAVSGSKNCKNGQKNSGSKNGRNGAISGSQNCRKGDKSFMSFRNAILSERPCKLINDSRVLAAKADQEIMTSLCTFPCILASLVVIFSLSHSVTHVFILWLYSMLDSE